MGFIDVLISYHLLMSSMSSRRDPRQLLCCLVLYIQWPFGRADYAHSHYASIMADVQITH